LVGFKTKVSLDDDLKAYGLYLDKLYLPTRYPNGFESGAPGDYYTEEDSRGAIERAERILAFCRRHVP
jgi:HEPN domain-containing protein